MTTVRCGENESVESALKRFKRKCQKDGIIGYIRRKEAYKKPSVKKKEKREAARKRARKRTLNPRKRKPSHKRSNSLPSASCCREQST